MVENVIIIGGGPAGLAAAVYTARANLNPLVIAGSPPGGQLMLTSEVENYPGFASILGPDLVEKFRSHAKKFGTRIVDRNVVKVDFAKRPFEIFLPNDARDVINHVSTKSVIISTGAKALWLNLSNEQRLRGKGVSACATCDGFFFKDKVVAVVGGGDTAMEEALFLTKFATKVYIIHRREQFRASKIMQERVFANKKIKIIWNTAIDDVLGEKKVEGLHLKHIHNQDGSSKISPQVNSSSRLNRDSSNIHFRRNFDSPSSDEILNVNGLFLAIGHKPDTDIFKGQIELDEKGYIITKLSMTNVPGVFAAGDCVDYVYRQAGTAVGMGIAAALEVERWLERRSV